MVSGSQMMATVAYKSRSLMLSQRRTLTVSGSRMTAIVVSMSKNLLLRPKTMSLNRLSAASLKDFSKLCRKSLLRVKSNLKRLWSRLSTLRQRGAPSQLSDHVRNEASKLIHPKTSTAQSLTSVRTSKLETDPNKKAKVCYDRSCFAVNQSE